MQLYQLRLPQKNCISKSAMSRQAFAPVMKVARCYANVVGFPLCAVAALMRAGGYILKVDIPVLCRRHFDYHCPLQDRGEWVL